MSSPGPHSTVPRAVIRGTGACLPPEILDNDVLGARLGVDAEWIRSRTGIDERRLLPAAADRLDLAVPAARAALREASWSASSLDLVLVASLAPGSTPGYAARLAHALDLRCAALDLGAACAGFVYALAVAAGQVALGAARRILVVGVEHLSPLVDWTDRQTAPLFGDGAGAVVVEAVSDPTAGIQGVWLGGEPAGLDLLGVREGRIEMQGPRLFKAAVRLLAEAATEALARAGWSTAELDLVVPHQANGRLLEALMRHLELPADRLVTDLAHHGNTSAASIPIALHGARARLRPGCRVLLVGLGAGLVHGAIALRW